MNNMGLDYFVICFTELCKVGLFFLSGLIGFYFLSDFILISTVFLDLAIKEPI